MYTRFAGEGRSHLTFTDHHQDPELSFASGDILVYLRHPGQSSRGPALRVHGHVLASRGFQTLLNQCVTLPTWHAPRRCLQFSCMGCEHHTATTGLYIPAPEPTDRDTVFDHHVTTRNFFAWLYDLPLTGRTLSTALTSLLARIHTYRGRQDYAQTKRDIIAYAESQGYLDFRECLDHALAVLKLAEEIHEQDLWIDAFTHVVGMSHRDLASSPEHEGLTAETQALIFDSRLEMDVRLTQASECIETFFGDDLSGDFLGLAQAAREHFDRFRSFLHGCYIEKYGFWPPAGFDDEARRFAIYSVLYTDFRNLYLHLVDSEPSTQAYDHVSSGGVCTLQNVEAFDRKHGFNTLPDPLPRIPAEPDLDIKMPSSHRRRSWNPVAQRRVDQEKRREQRVQALFRASNRDLSLMSCDMVRRYSQFEEDSIGNESDRVSWIDGRKVRWILVYAILQLLISVMATPKTVRNTEGLSYPTCCLIPGQMPWRKSDPKASKEVRVTEIVPDIDYRALSTPATDLSSRARRGSDHRHTMLGRTPSSTRVSSLKRLLKRRHIGDGELAPSRAPASRGFTEILVHGYGNGLNDVEVTKRKDMTLPTTEQMDRGDSLLVETPLISDQHDSSADSGSSGIPSLAHSVVSSVSRETSTASSNTTWSKSTQEDDDVNCPGTPTGDNSTATLVDVLDTNRLDIKTSIVLDHPIDELALHNQLQFDTTMWDTMLLSQPPHSY